VKVAVTVSTEMTASARMRQVSSMFDAPIVDKATRSWSGEVPIEAKPWSIGLIVGPSGAGKSTIARQMFGSDYRVAWDDKRSVVDNFPAELKVDDVSSVLSAVGFNTIPAWLRPHATLSNGEKFRCDLARTLIAPEPLVWVDEFTSVVDRQVAKIGSASLARYVRSKPGRQFVAVGCHYDVIDWLQPDWILEPADMTFAWRSVQPRPRFDAVLRRCSISLWPRFAPYHYMSSTMHNSARCYAMYVDGRPIAFAGLLPLPVPAGRYKGTAIWRISRIVVLPDWQGCGVVNRMNEALGSAYATLGHRFRCYPTHAALVAAHQRKPELWTQKADGANAMLNCSTARDKTSTTGVQGGRPCSVFEYVGPLMERGQAERFLALG
jgi:GNAT superfamily N-acetyltransferase